MHASGENLCEFFWHCACMDRPEASWSSIGLSPCLPICDGYWEIFLWDMLTRFSVFTRWIFIIIIIISYFCCVVHVSVKGGVTVLLFGEDDGWGGKGEGAQLSAYQLGESGKQKVWFWCRRMWRLISVKFEQRNSSS